MVCSDILTTALLLSNRRESGAGKRQDCPKPTEGRRFYSMGILCGVAMYFIGTSGSLRNDLK